LKLIYWLNFNPVLDGDEMWSILLGIAYYTAIEKTCFLDAANRLTTFQKGNYLNPTLDGGAVPGRGH